MLRKEVENAEQIYYEEYFITGFSLSDFFQLRAKHEKQIVRDLNETF